MPGKIPHIRKNKDKSRLSLYSSNEKERKYNKKVKIAFSSLALGWRCKLVLDSPLCFEVERGLNRRKTHSKQWRQVPWEKLAQSQQNT